MTKKFKTLSRSIFSFLFRKLYELFLILKARISFGKRAGNLFKKCDDFTEIKIMKQKGLYPYFRTIESPQSNEIIVDGKKLIMMCSNNYLGLSDHPRIKEAMKKAVDKYGGGCTGSRFLNGNLDIHEELESSLSQFVGKEQGLVFSSGFMTNLGIIESLLGPGDIALTDRYDHASIIVGCKLSFGMRDRFNHNDMDDLEYVLKKYQGSNGIFVIVDGVFSIEGDVIDLQSIIKLSKKYNAKILLDDAHGFGILGNSGKGTMEHLNVNPKDIDVYMTTFSKALASLGGIAIADEKVIDYIRHHAKAQIFTTGLSPADVAATLEALKIIQEEPERRETLLKNAFRLRDNLKLMGYDTGSTCTQIIPVLIGENDDVGKFIKRATEEGVCLGGAMFPAVPRGKSLIRLTCMATHTDEQVDRVLEIFEKIGKELSII